MIKTVFLLLTFFSCCLMQLNGQTQIDTTQQIQINKDTTEVVQDDPYGVFDMFKGNPGKAALYSLIIPGAGQVYNKQYWKVPIVWAAEGAAIYNLVSKWQEYNRWDTDWKLLATNQPAMYSTNMTSVTAVKEIRDDEREARDQAWLIVIGVHLIATADAFVSRHLIEFDVDDDITIIIDPISPVPGFNLTMNF